MPENLRFRARRTPRTAGLVALLASAAIGSSSTPSAAQDQLVPRPPRIMPPGRSLAGTDDSDAIALNPAQIAYMPSWELRYTHVQTPKDSTSFLPGRGDALGLATPLFFGLATGVRFDFVRPPRDASLPRMTAFSWDFAWRLGAGLALATNVRRWYADDLPALDGATAIDLGLALRTCRWLGLAFVARDLNGPRGRSPDFGATLTRSFDFAAAVRPLGTRAIELGLEATVYGRADLPGAPTWSPRATLGVDIPYVGRALLSGQIYDPTTGYSAKNSWALTAGVEIGLGPSRLGGGAIVGKALRPGQDLGSPGWYVSAAVAGYEEPGLRLPDRAVTIRIEDTPGSRGHVHLLRRLARLRRDPTVKAVALIAKSEPASSTAHAEELADALAALQASGKKVVCQFEDGGGRGLLACAGADRILLSPAGGLRFAGLRSQTMYFGEGLHKIGVEPDFVRIKEHKSAPEGFVREGPTPQAAADQREYLAAVEAVYLDRLAAGRHLSREQVKAAIAKGPFIADEAIAVGFADAKAFDDELPKHVREVVGKYLRVEEDEPIPEAPRSFGPAPKIAIVYLDGDIVDGRSSNVPLIGEKMVGSYTIVDALDAVRKDPTIKGVVIRIESPGGSSLASDVMWRAEELLQLSGKPVAVSMGSVAASGGYYTAAFGAPIFADRATVTGSIGIFYGKADISGLLGKLGVHIVTEKTAPKADAESLFRPFTDDERAELLVKVAQFYAVFLDRVARGRKMTIEQVDAVGHGKVWLGDAAKQHGLVDTIGGVDQALAWVRQQADLDDDTPIAEYPPEKNGLLGLVLDLMGAKAPSPEAQAEAEAALPKLLGEYLRAIVPFVVYRPDEPLAMWEGMSAP